METSEAQTGIKALYLQAAQLAGLEVSHESPEVLVEIVQKGFPLVDAARRPEAVANALRLIGETLLTAQRNNQTKLFESSVRQAQTAVCPVYPFGP